MFIEDPRRIRRTLLCLILGLTGCGGGGGGGGGGESSTSATASAPPVTTPATNTTQPPATATDPQTTLTEATQIKLLALYTNGVTEQFSNPDVRIQHMVNVANDVVTESGIELEFTLEHIEAVDYPDHVPITQALDDLTLANHTAFSHIPALRDQVSADLVVLVRPYANDGHCGYAWIGGFGTGGDFSNPTEAEYGYSVAASNCSDYTLLHELGHNLGLGHSRRESPDGGTFDYAVGYGMDNDFVTIMASPQEFSATQLPKLSSPSLECNGMPCGIAHTSTQGGSDAVRALNVSKEQVARYR